MKIREVQAIQDAVDHLRLVYVPADGFSQETAQNLVAGVRDVMGPIQVTLEETDSIPRGPNGKFRPHLCLVKDVDEITPLA